MAYFQDLSQLAYHRGIFDQSNWRCPLLAIGWLEEGENYLKGEVSSEFTTAISQLVVIFEYIFPHVLYRGKHNCSLCTNSTMLNDSYINLIIPGTREVYVAPGAINHYVEEHGYKPPAQFISAVLACPEPTSEEYRAELKKINHEIEAPLFL